MFFNSYVLLTRCVLRSRYHLVSSCSSRRFFSKSRLRLIGVLWMAAFIFLTPKYVHTPAPEEHTLAHRPVTPTSNMDIFAPILDPSEWRSWITENAKTTHSLFKCIELSNCGQNQTKGALHAFLFPRHDSIYLLLVVIFDSHHFRLVLEGEWTGGEGIWATSTVRSLDGLLFMPLR